jgi:hypothetical protein
MAVALSLALGALAWIVNQGGGYPLVKVACASGERTLLTWVSAGAMVLAMAGFFSGMRGRRLERFRMLALVAIGFNALALLYVLDTRHDLGIPLEVSADPTKLFPFVSRDSATTRSSSPIVRASCSSFGMRPPYST